MGWGMDEWHGPAALQPGFGPMVRSVPHWRRPVQPPPPPCAHSVSSARLPPPNLASCRCPTRWAPQQRQACQRTRLTCSRYLRTVLASWAVAVRALGQRRCWLSTPHRQAGGGQGNVYLLARIAASCRAAAVFRVALALCCAIQMAVVVSTERKVAPTGCAPFPRRSLDAPPPPVVRPIAPPRPAHTGQPVVAVRPAGGRLRAAAVRAGHPERHHVEGTGRHGPAQAGGGAQQRHFLGGRQHWPLLVSPLASGLRPAPL